MASHATRQGIPFTRQGIRISAFTHRGTMSTSCSTMTKSVSAMIAVRNHWGPKLTYQITIPV